MRLKHILLWLLLLTGTVVQGQKTSGTDFWMAFTQNADTDLDKEYFLKVFLSAQEATEVTIENEKLGFKQTISVGANSLESVTIPFDDFNMSEYGEVVNKSLHITSEKEISVYAENYQIASCDASLVLSTEACGSYYIIQNNVSRTESKKYTFRPSTFNIVAFEDDTEVEITPTLTTSDGRPANVPFTITLNKGDVYQVANLKEDMGKGLSGSQVQVLYGKKAAVYSGNNSSNVPDECISGDSDILYDVAYPVSSWGKNFIIRPFSSGNYDMIKCTACKDGTKIYKNGELIATINAFESYDFIVDESDGAFKLETSEPVATYQYMTSSLYLKNRTGGPSYQYVAPIEQAIEEATFSTIAHNELHYHYINLVIKTEDVETITLNGKTGFATFSPVDDVYSTASVSIEKGTYTLRAKNGFVANAYGSGEWISYSYSVGSKIDVINDTEENKIRKPCGDGTEECPFHITTAGEFLYFAAVINGTEPSIPVNEYAHAVLDADIDLSGVCGPEIGSWTPIGYGTARFRGVFNGHNHRIKNIYVVNDKEGTGLFGLAAGGAEIRNVILASGSISSTSLSVGGIVGVGVVKLIDCHNYVNIYCSSKFNGGIIGYAGKDSYIEKCHNEGNITSTSSNKSLFGVGGIAGAASTDAIVTDCYSLGNITGHSSRVGGVVGSAENCLITNCYSYGDVESTENDHGGGLCAIATDYPYTKVENSYYFNSLGKTGQQPEMERPESDFNDGTIFALLNEHTPNLWRQEEGKYPVFIDTVFNVIPTKTLYVDLCQGDSVMFYGKKITESGTYYPSCSCGGDTLVVKVLSPAVKELYETIAAGESYHFGSQDISEAGVYTDTVKGGAANGCDSIVILHLTVDGPSSKVINESICEGETYTFDGKELTEGGVYTMTENEVTTTLNLTVLPKSVTVLYDTLCTEFMGEPDLETEEKLVAANGCDSVVVHHIHYKQNVSLMLEGEFCLGAFEYGGVEYTEPGHHLHVVPGVGGECDTLIHLYITKLNMIVDEINDTICAGSSYNFADRQLTEPGRYSDTMWCEKITHLNLYVNPVSTSQIVSTVHVGESYKANGFDLPEQEAEGIFYFNQVETNQFGCDSIITLALNVIKPADNTVIPTLFTPHTREGKNDIFMEGYEVYIYDRYGNLVCHSANGWDGKYRGKEADPGIYIYTLFMKDGEKKKGSIEVYKK
ncbi:MAG: gliding motility-associated C-terminal domain-containing protein [Paludibacteraceae bacterium]|nr:gliding motility-associated C-terminal domain-containing protein [Paludibacteraceae bacterium]